MIIKRYNMHYGGKYFILYRPRAYSCIQPPQLRCRRNQTALRCNSFLTHDSCFLFALFKKTVSRLSFINEARKKRPQKDLVSSSCSFDSTKINVSAIQILAPCLLIEKKVKEGIAPFSIVLRQMCFAYYLHHIQCTCTF